MDAQNLSDHIMLSSEETSIIPWYPCQRKFRNGFIRDRKLHVKEQINLLDDTYDELVLNML